MTFRIIAGAFKGRKLKAPKGTSTRPTQGMVREAVFNICQNEIEGSRFLDLYAGSGAMGLEALSRGAAKATFIEADRTAAACIKENVAELHVEPQAVLLPVSASRAIHLLQGNHFDIVYVDPPYETPFELESLMPLLAPNALLFVEGRHSPRKSDMPPVSPRLSLKDTRRFGIAVLFTFYNKEKS